MLVYLFLMEWDSSDSATLCGMTKNVLIVDSRLMMPSRGLLLKFIANIGDKG